MIKIITENFGTRSGIHRIDLVISETAITAFYYERTFHHGESFQELKRTFVKLNFDDFFTAYIQLLQDIQEYSGIQLIIVKSVNPIEN